MNQLTCGKRLLHYVRQPTSKHRYIMVYCAMFALMFLCFAGPALVVHRGFIYAIDGTSQQYPFFLLEGEWLRNLLYNAFVLHTFQVPQWTMLLGYGTDYITALSSYTGNPFYLISVFSTPENGELLLSLTIPLQLACASGIFTRLCRYHGKDRFMAMVGGLSYAFMGYSVNAYTQTPFLLWVVAAPLVLLGVDEVIDGRSPVTLIVATALCFLNSISLSYQVCLLLVLYCSVRFALTFARRTPREFILLFMRVAIPLVLGAMIGMALFLPVVMSIVGQTRLGVERALSLWFSRGYYKLLVTSFLSVSWPGVDGTPIGGLALSSLCAITLFALRRREHPSANAELRVARVLSIAFMIVLFFPVPSSVLNGMSYPSLRWTWAVSLLLAYVTVLVLPLLPRLSQVERARFVVLWLVYGAMALWATHRAPSWPLIAALILVVALLVVMCQPPRGLLVRRVMTCGALVASCLALFGPYFWAEGYGQTIPFNSAYPSLYAHTPLSLLGDRNLSSSDRYTLRGMGPERNTSVIVGAPGDTFYNSLYSNETDELLSSLGLISHTNNFSWTGFDARLGLEALSGVDCLVAPVGDSSYPYPAIGYSLLSQADTYHSGSQTFGCYEAEAPVRLGTLHAVTYPRSLYDALNMVQRQNLLISGVVLEHGVGAVAPASPGVPALGISDATPIALEASQPSETAVVGEGEVDVADGGATVTLPVDIPAGEKAYLMLRGLSFQGRSALDAHAFVRVTSGQASESVMQANALETWYGNKHDWVIDLGTDSQQRSSIVLTFSNAGQYGLQAIETVFENEAMSAQLVRDFANEGPTDLAFDSQDGNLMQGSMEVTAAEGRTLLVRVPYGRGWSATVDDTPVDIDRADVAFMAIHLSQGSHRVVFRYQTPYLAVGACVSGAGILLALLYVKLFIKKLARVSGKHE